MNRTPHLNDRSMTTKIHIGLTNLEKKWRAMEIIISMISGFDNVVEFAETKKIYVDVLVPIGPTNLVDETQQFKRDDETANSIRQRLEFFSHEL